MTGLVNCSLCCKMPVAKGKGLKGNNCAECDFSGCGHPGLLRQSSFYQVITDPLAVMCKGGYIYVYSIYVSLPKFYLHFFCHVY